MAPDPNRINDAAFARTVYHPRMTHWFSMIGVVLGLVLATAADAQSAEPVLSSGVSLRADRATVVQAGETKLLLLQGDVSISVGGYGFTDQQALVRITRRTGLGESARDLAFVFENPTSIGGGGVQADAKHLLVTVASKGKIELTAELTKADALPKSKLATIALQLEPVALP